MVPLGKVRIYPACSGEVKERRDFLKRLASSKPSKISQIKKHPRQKVKKSGRFICLDLGKQIARQIPYSGTVYYLKLSDTISILR